MEHGKSYSETLPLGSRRKAVGMGGIVNVLAPKHFRKLGKKLMNDVTDEEIAEVYFNEDITAINRSINSLKGQNTKYLNAGNESASADCIAKIEAKKASITSIIEKVNDFRSA